MCRVCMAEFVWAEFVMCRVCYGSSLLWAELTRYRNTCNLRRISREIMDMVFLLVSLIQERQFLVISESICPLDHFVLVNCLEGLSGAGWVVNLIASPGIIDRESAKQIYYYMCRIVVTLSRSLHKFR